MTETFQEIWVFKLKSSSPLKSTDLLVYSYLCKRDSFGNDPPTNAGVAKATGLCPRAVASIRDRLTLLDFVTEGRPVHRPESFHGAKRSGGHFSAKYQFFKCYLPSEDSPLSVNDAMVWSFLVGLKEMEKPPEELQPPYAANALGIDPRTVAKCFERLNELKLARLTDAEWALPDRLTDEQKGWFMPKAGKSSPKKPGAKLGTFSPDDEPVLKGQMMPLDHSNRTDGGGPRAVEVQVELTPIDVIVYYESVLGVKRDDNQFTHEFGKFWRTLTKQDKTARDWQTRLLAKYKEFQHEQDAQRKAKEADQPQGLDLQH